MIKRRPTLYPLSHHHHHALGRALEIRRAAERPEPERTAALRRAGAALVEFWKSTGSVHFRDEEVLLPACARHVNIAEEPAFGRMLAEHAAIRARLQELEQALADDRPTDALTIELGRMLHDHVRLEEEQVFPRAEALLGEAGLQAIAPHLTQLHPHTCETKPGEHCDS